MKDAHIEGMIPLEGEQGYTPVKPLKVKIVEETRATTGDIIQTRLDEGASADQIHAEMDKHRAGKKETAAQQYQVAAEVQGMLGNKKEAHVMDTASFAQEHGGVDPLLPQRGKIKIKTNPIGHR